jgi:hypothetical protein
MVNADARDGITEPATLREVQAYYTKSLREEARLSTDDSQPEAVVTRIQCERCVSLCVSVYLRVGCGGVACVCAQMCTRVCELDSKLVCMVWSTVCLWLKYRLY